VDRTNLWARAQIATEVIREAGEIAVDFYRRRERIAVESKGVQDLVSEADRACEDLIVARLSSSFPDDSLLGEEGGLRQRGATTWVIDPIDGTANFVRGISHWCISIGLLIGGKAVLGLVFDPVANELFSAMHGAGARLNGEEIAVSGETDLAKARIGIGFSYRRPVAPHARDIEALLDAHCEYSRLGSGALGMAYTACGRFDGYWERHINSWDVVGGLALVSEAGGRTNNFLHGDFLLKGNEVLAATPLLLDSLSKLLRR
jgi:myo-inositol-1(or 4)-monophosphatase